jgi:hypothetical protein
VGLFLLCALVGVSSLRAQVLLTIRIINPEEIIISATGAAPSVSDNVNTVGTGFDLVGLDLSSFGGTASNTLYAAQATPKAGKGVSTLYFNGFQPDSYGANGTANFFVDTVSDNSLLNFATGEAAFSGSMTITLFDTFDVAVGTTGAIYSGDLVESPGTALEIGEWEVVPECPSWVLLLLGGVGLFAGRQWQRRSLITA